MSYGGNGVTISAPKPTCACACACNGAKKGEGAKPRAAPANNGEVDFAKMSAAQKVAYHKARWDRILG
jgi:hypothetical protein